jgi:homoserine kinase
MSKKVTVSVPASSANLGPGYDSLALALELRDVITAQLTGDNQVEVSVTGIGSENLPKDESHLIAQTIIQTAKQLGVEIGGFKLTCANAIPQGRGLGSSAAAIVAGLILTRELTGLEISDDYILQEATNIEGHPDNVSACLMGGLTISWETPEGQANTRAMNVSPAIVPIVGIPDAELSTEKARELIPTQIAHIDAVFNSARTALLVAALVADPSSLLDATADRLHQQYRRSAYPESMKLVDLLREKGIAACISGAGPSVLALATAENANLALGLISVAGFTGTELAIANEGAFVPVN